LKHYILWTFGLVEAETQTSAKERKCLAKWAKGKKRIVEIGVFHAVNTGLFRRLCSPDGIVFGIDPFPKGRLGISLHKLIAHKEVNKIKNATICWLEMTGMEAAKWYAREEQFPIDFLFVDGDHSYESIKEDWSGWSHLIARNGIVALHDSCSSSSRNIENAGSVIFTREVILKDLRFQVVDIQDTLTVLERT